MQAYDIIAVGAGLFVTAMSILLYLAVREVKVLDGRIADQTLAARDVGDSRSTPKPGASQQDWAGAMTALADHEKELVRHEKLLLKQIEAVRSSVARVVPVSSPTPKRRAVRAAK